MFYSRFLLPCYTIGSIIRLGKLASLRWRLKPNPGWSWVVLALLASRAGPATLYDQADHGHLSWGEDGGKKEKQRKPVPDWLVY